MIAPSETTVHVSPEPAAVPEHTDRLVIEHAARTQAAVKRLGRALAEIQRKCPTLPVRAIHWMYAKHPIHPVQDEMLRQHEAGHAAGSPVGSVRRPSAARLIGRYLLCWCYAGYLTLRLLQVRWQLRRHAALLRRQSFDLVAKTWRFGPTQPRDGSDFYYGDLQRRFAARGARLLLLNGNAHGRGWGAFAVGNVSVTCPWQIPEWCLVPLTAPYAMALQQLRTFFRLRRLVSSLSDPLSRQVAERASWECLSRQVTPVGLFGWLGEVIVRQWHPRALLALYEGHGWEQCLWWGAKRADPSCRSVGYQHTILLPHNLALLGTQEEASLTQPDVVLCLGPRMQTMLQPNHPHSALLNFGTIRVSPETAVRQPPRPGQPAVLVLPEGLIDEEQLIYNFALRAARRLPQCHFIFRRHPMYLFDERLRRVLTEDPASVPNVEISEGRPIDEDFARASIVLYRGTSSALYAVLKGLKPVYLYDPAHHEVDPLFELDGWRERIGSVDELAEVVERYSGTSAEEAAPAWREAASYVEECLKPVDDASISALLAAVGLAPEGRPR